MKQVNDGKRTDSVIHFTLQQESFKLKHKDHIRYHVSLISMPHFSEIFI